MLNDAKTRAIAIQGVLMLALVGFTALLIVTTVANLEARGIPIGFDFLTMPSRLVISESVLPYGSRDPYYWAIIVGIGNTILISTLVIIASSVIGLILGIARLSSNPLASGTCKVWIEVARNTPPIVLLIFLYSLWWKVLPPIGQALNIAPGVYVSMRGLAMPGVDTSLQTIVWIFLGLACLWVGATVVRLLTQRRLPFWIPTLLSAIFVGLWVSNASIKVDWPVQVSVSGAGSR